jgi:hypothetical protein
VTFTRGLSLILLVVSIGAAARYGPELVTHWRADRAAHQFGSAVFKADSLEVASLTRSGSARTVLCARRLWPEEFWMTGNRTRLPIRRTEPYGGAYGYQMVGRSLPDHRGRAVFEFYISPDRPTKVQAFFVDSRTGVWDDTVRACMRP